jgi:hypothetical protein
MCFRNQRRLRQIFIAGHIIGIVLFFVSEYVPNIGWVSELESVCYLFNVGDTASALWKMAQLTGRIAFLALGIYHPRRWVFIAGAAWASLILGTKLIAGDEATTIHGILSYTQVLMRMTGFFIK